MEFEFIDEDFLFENLIGTHTPHPIENTPELQIVHDLQETYRLRYRSDYVTPSGRILHPRNVSDRLGNNYVTLKMAPNLQGKIRVDWVTMPDRTGRRYIMPHHLTVPDIDQFSNSGSIMQDIETDSDGLTRLYLGLTKASRYGLRHSELLVHFQPVMDALHNASVPVHERMLPRQFSRESQLHQSQLAFTWCSTIDGISFVPQWCTTVFSTVMTESHSLLQNRRTAADDYYQMLSASVNTSNGYDQELSMVEDTMERSKRQKLDNTRLDNMAESIINASLLALPIEIIHRIFDYCHVKTILSARSVCKYMHACAGTYNRFQLTFKTAAPSTAESALRLIQSESIISLTISYPGNVTSFENDQIHSFYSLLGNLQFPRLSSLTVREASDMVLKYLVQNFLRTNCLASISIESSNRRTKQTWTSVLSTFKQHNLRKLCISNVETMAEHISWPDRWKLEHLVIDDCTCNGYLLMLRQLPHLRTFSMRDVIADDVEIQALSDSNNTSSSTLESLTMTRCSLSACHLELFLSLTPSLRQLKLVSHREAFDSFFDATNWENLISIKLPELKTFEFIFFHTDKNDSMNIELLLTPFRSSFWLQEKQWFVAGAYGLKDNMVWFYTTATDFVGLRDFVRLETSSTDNRFRLTQRPLHKGPAPVSDQTLTVLDLYSHPINHQKMQALLNALDNNTTLVELNLGGNQLGNQGVQDLALCLQNNKTLAILRLWQNRIGHEGVQYLTNRIHHNTMLKELYLGNNQIRNQGAQYFAHVLQNNTTLTTLDLNANEIGRQGIQDLADSLKSNKTLVTLGLEHNQIANQEAQYLITALEYNMTLQHLYLNTDDISAEVWNQFPKRDNQYLANNFL